MAIVGDAANLLLNGIPGDVHDLFIVDVEPGDLARASTAMMDLADVVHSVHLTLGDSVATLEGRWEGEGATAFHVEIWEPLSDGLAVLEHECHHAALQLTSFALQAEQAHVAKVEELTHEIDRQLNIMAITVFTPGAGKAISEVVGNIATRLGGEVVSGIVANIVKAIEELIQKLLAAFKPLFRELARPLAGIAADMREELVNLFRTGFGPRDASATPQTIGSVRWWGPPKPTGLRDSALQGIANELYRPGAKIGNGGTADAIRAGSGHVVKGLERVVNLGRWIATHPGASPGDKHAAQAMLQDLIAALLGEGYPGP